MSTLLHHTRPDGRDVLLVIANDGPEIVATNFWNTPLAGAGGMFCSVNAGAVRLLLPRALERQAADMVGHEVIVTRGPWPAAGQRDALELVWEDDSDTPFAVCLGAAQIDWPLPASGTERTSTCLVYVRGFDGAPMLAGRWPARVRTAKSLPSLHLWHA